MELVKLPLSPDELLRLGAAVVFALIILCALLSIVVNRIHRAYCRFRKRDDIPTKVFRERVRLAGGFAVFLFAVVTHDWMVSTAAVFIGGLLIAPEQFLLLLAAILRADRKAAADIAINITKMTSKQIREKRENDADDAKDDDDNTKPPAGPGAPSGSAESSQRATSSIISKVKRVEEDVIKLLGNKVGSQYSLEPYAMLKRGSRVAQFDGLLIEKSTARIHTAIEIKYLSHMSSSRVGAILSRSERLLSDEYSVLFVFVFENYSQSSLERIFRLREKFISENKNLGIAFYARKDDVLLPLHDIDTSILS